MTVCVAAICEHGNRIVMASDSRIGDDVMSADTPIAKFESFKNWTVMFAGKLGDSCAIVKTIKRTVENSPTKVDEVAMMHIAQRAFTEQKMEMASFPILSSHNLTHAEFVQDGKKRFTPKEHARITNEINQNGYGFDAQLLVCGWGQYEPTLFTVDEKGLVHRDREGFAAIGIGHISAYTMMMWAAKNALNSFHIDANLWVTLLYVAGAKFFAERTDGVGTNTYIRIATRGMEQVFALTSDDIANLRHWWNTTMAPGSGANNIQDGVAEMLRERIPRQT
jgi:20S proteasome alpha/beta subunit